MLKSVGMRTRLLENIEFRANQWNIFDEKSLKIRHCIPKISYQYSRWLQLISKKFIREKMMKERGLWLTHKTIEICQNFNTFNKLLCQSP